MIVRSFLDYLAILHFLLKRHPKNAWSVVQARRDFNRQKNNYNTIRKENLEKTVNELPSGMFHNNLLWNYYVKNKKLFNQIFPNEGQTDK